MKYVYNNKEIIINKELIINLKNLDCHSVDFLEKCKIYCMKFYNRAWAKGALKKINKELYGSI